MRITVHGAGEQRAGKLAEHEAWTRPALDLELDPGETVLEALTRQGVRLPSACQAGVCQTCMVRVLEGDPGRAGVAGLDQALRADGYFLACQARPAASLTVALAGGDIYAPARLLGVADAGAGVLRVRVRPERPLKFRPGQHVALRVRGGLLHEPEPGLLPGEGDLVRAYSIASLAGEIERGGLEFHVRAYPGGAMSGWLTAAAPGAEVSLGRPAGTCCYQPGEPDGALLLAGTGTGLAPLGAIAREALARGHAGPVVLIRGGADAGSLYPDDLLPAAGVWLLTCVLARGEDLTAAAVAQYAGLARPEAARAFLCGGPGVVSRTRRALFLAGLSLRRIPCDEFSPAVTAPSFPAP
jgi:CDP-4-dehydro-6-deoxyglucose reductase